MTRSANSARVPTKRGSRDLLLAPKLLDSTVFQIAGRRWGFTFVYMTLFTMKYPPISIARHDECHHHLSNIFPPPKIAFVIVREETRLVSYNCRGLRSL